VKQDSKGAAMDRGQAETDVVTETARYPGADGASVEVFLARPSGTGRSPALLLSYEFWGMLEVPGGGPHMRDIAKRLAHAGYVVAVPDYYAARGQQPTMEGGVIKGSPTDEQTISDLCLGVEWLAGLPSVESDRIGCMGWCGGGRQALFMAAHCSHLRAVASFYGRPVNRAGRPGLSPIELVPQIHCPVFAAYGAADQGIPVETVHRFAAALEQAHVPHEVHIFPDAGHAFMNDQRDSYVAAAAADAWQKALAFLARHLGEAAPR
jgi:carboxymethylenebutenolidase